MNDDADDNRLVFSKFQNGYTDNTPATARTSNTVRLVNLGNKPLTISSAVLGGSDASAFSIATPISSPITLSAGQTRDITVNFIATSGAVHNATLSFVTDSRNSAPSTVELSGLWQSYPETNPQGVSQEPSLQQIIDAFGFRTYATYGSQVLDTNGVRTATGDEVLSDYWERADTLKPVYVKQLAAYRSADYPAKFAWIRQNTKTDNNSVFVASSTENQTVLPKVTGSTTKAAQGSFVPTTSVFGFRIDNEYGVDSFNTPAPNTSEVNPHRMRVFPVRDQNYNYVRDTYLVTVDYAGYNYDYNDGLYLVSNIKPSGKTTSVPGLAAFNEGGKIRLDFGDVSGATGYNVYRSDKANTGFSKITSSVLTSSTYLDSTATSGKTWYYRVVAVNGSGEGNLVSTSVKLA
ncbi:MAG: hypothetical protein QM770_05445 [Tepidisphaeraceae bacterium]